MTGNFRAQSGLGPLDSSRFREEQLLLEKLLSCREMAVGVFGGMVEVAGLLRETQTECLRQQKFATKELWNISGGLFRINNIGEQGPRNKKGRRLELWNDSPLCR